MAGAAVTATGIVSVGCHLVGAEVLSRVLLGVAAVSWVGLLPQVVRRVPGSAYLTCGAGQSLGVLGATPAAATGVTWPLPVAVVLLAVGFGLYVLVLLHFDFHLLNEGAGDHWVACGAPLKWAEPLRPWLLAVTLVLLLAALAWYAVIAVAELRWPRPGYDPRRWATVFPLGMTAVAALTAAGEVGPATSGWLEPLGRVLLWVAVAVWALAAAGL
ncbi:hypothetical protein CLM81_17010, partial [Streptomyces albidoflavus]